MTIVKSSGQALPFKLTAEEAMALAEAAGRQSTEVANLARGFRKGSDSEKELLAKSDILKRLKQRLTVFALNDFTEEPEV